MGFKKFSLFIALRTSLIMVSLLALTYLLTTPGYHAASILLFILLSYQCVDIVRYVSKTNAELVRFFDAARYADFSQRFELSHLGAGFAELGDAFSDILKRIQQVRSGQEQELKHMKAMVEHVPVPLLSIHSSGEVTLWNNSARRLFGSHQIIKESDFQQFGEVFNQALTSLQPGKSKLVTLEIDNMQHQLALAATQLVVAGKSELLISMQDIQSELDGVQLQAWQDLVRVLTHEIMNSITPVASLAKTTVDLVEDVKSQLKQESLLEELNDVSDAVNTVARRSDSLMQFVSNYRQLTRLPEAVKENVLISEMFTRVSQLATQTWQEKGITLELNIEPESIKVHADPDMLEQLLLNLILNAEQAVSSQQSKVDKHAGIVKLSAFINKRGHTVIEVADNGPGIAEEIKHKVFVPFYTTKREGSGVGLALTRQIMIAHGGTVKLDKSNLGGAQLSLTF